MRKTLFLAVILVFSLWAASCDSGSSPFSPVARSLLHPSGLRLTVTTSEQGSETLTFHIEIKNVGDQTEALSFGSSQVFDIGVRNSSGTTVWQWAYDKYFAALVWRLELPPGESYSQEVIWNLTGNDKRPLPPGSYEARVFITSSPQYPELADEVSLRI